jgi:predicted metal-dependent HD superfamily phosphohydrolase
MYASSIRKEYCHLSDAVFNSGRRSVLAEFLGRGRLYLSIECHEEFDSSARANLSRELHGLQ